MTVRLPLLLVSLAWFGGCQSTDGPIEARFEECRDLVANKDMQTESLECFTPYSRRILTNLLSENKSSSGVLSFLPKYTKLLNFEDITMPADIDGSTAILVVGKGRVRETIVFQYDADEDEWFIDALELTHFWRTLDNALEGG